MADSHESMAAPPHAKVFVRALRNVSEFCALATLLLTGSCSRQTAPNDVDQTERPATVEHREHFDQLPPVFADETPTLSHEVLVRNDTQLPVHFAQVQPACSCTGAELAKNLLGPGEQTTLKISAQLHGRSGKQRFMCTLIDERGNRWVYGIETTVYTAARFAETGALHFGLVDPNSDCLKATEFLVCGHDPTVSVECVVVSTDSDRIRATVGEAVRLSVGDGMIMTKIPIEVRLHAPVSAGIGNGAIKVRLKSDPKSEFFQEICWNVRSLYVVEPRQVFFGAVGANSRPTSRLVTVRREDGQPISINAVRSAHKAIVAKVKPSTDKSAVQLELLLFPARLAATFWQEVEVEVSHPIQRVIKIPVGAIFHEVQPLRKTVPQKGERR